METNQLFHNRYRLIKKLGRGSFGEVWQARDEVTDIDVAIKVYIALDDHGLEEFKGEFKTVHSLNHPNLLRPEHYDIFESQPFLVMQLCGGSVERQVGKMEESEIWRFIRDVSRGLAYLHEREIVHRDIKPDNILQNEIGDYVISDFGISTKMRSTLRRNSTRQKREVDVSGTIAYMAPELFTKTPAAVKATDIWALGAALYEIVKDELLFMGQGGILQLKGAEIPSLPDSYSEDLRTVVEDCLRLETWNRPTAEELARYAEAKVKGEKAVMSWKQRSKPGGGGQLTPPQDLSGHTVKANSDGNLVKMLIWAAVAVVFIGLAVWVLWPKGNTNPSIITPLPSQDSILIAHVKDSLRVVMLDSISNSNKNAEAKKKVAAEAKQRQIEKNKAEKAAEAEKKRLAEEKARQEAAAAEQKRLTEEKAEKERLATEAEKQKALAAKLSFTVKGVSFNMIRVNGGTFSMGATSEQGSEAYSQEKPVHSVTLSDYYIGETEVTQALWYAVMGSKPTSYGSQWDSSYGLGDNCPAYYVSWEDCQKFIKELNRLTGRNFALPTEAQWEYAARGGNRSKGYKYSGGNNIGSVAWYDGDSGSRTHQVAIKLPNELGIYDMSGNVREWCQDWYGDYSSNSQTNPKGASTGSYRVFRGGSWDDLARSCRVSDRYFNNPSFCFNFLGFRLALP